MRIAQITALLVLCLSAIAEEPSDSLSLVIEIDNGRVLGVVRNVSTNTVTVHRTFGLWEFTTVLYHDGQKWREAPLREAERARLGVASKATLKPNEILVPERRSALSREQDLKQYAFILNLTGYELPKDVTHVRQLRVVTSGLWSDILDIGNPNQSLQRTEYRR